MEYSHVTTLLTDAPICGSLECDVSAIVARRGKLDSSLCEMRRQEFSREIGRITAVIKHLGPYLKGTPDEKAVHAQWLIHFSQVAAQPMMQGAFE